MKKITLLFAFGLSCIATKAGHFRGIDIASTQLAGYDFKVHADVYMNLTGLTDTTYLYVNYGDGATDTLEMISGTGTAYPSVGIEEFNFGEAHLYSGPGTYTLTFTVKNWSDGIVNITDATNTQFIGNTTIVVDPLLGSNNFGGFNYSMLDGSITGNDYSFDLSANEPEGDSVVFTQQPASQLTVPATYQYPSSMGGTESFVAGVYHFDNIPATGQYAVSYRVEEYRSGSLIAAHLREFSLDYTLVTAIREQTKNNLVLFPNPCTHTLYVPSEKGVSGFSLYNMNGKSLLTAVTNQLVDVSFLQPGLYLVKTADGKVSKLVKE